MNMAVAYGLKKRQKFANGGPACGACRDGNCMEHGGMVGGDDIVGKIMAKRMSKGGMVANETPTTADFAENEFDDLVLRDDLESSYTGANSGDELGNEQEDADRHDIVSRIMRSRSKKDRMPRPA